MQGQSSPVQVKDAYTGSILMHVGSSCKHNGVYNVHLPRIIRNWLMGVTRKQNKTEHVSTSLRIHTDISSRNERAG